MTYMKTLYYDEEDQENSQRPQKLQLSKETQVK